MCYNTNSDEATESVSQDIYAYAALAFPMMRHKSRAADHNDGADNERRPSADTFSTKFVLTIWLSLFNFPYSLNREVPKYP